MCVEGSYFQKAKNCTNDFESRLVIVWAIDVDDVIVDQLKYSLSCECCFRASTVPLVQCTSTFSELFTFTEVSVLFQKLFLT